MLEERHVFENFTAITGVSNQKPIKDAVIIVQNVIVNDQLLPKIETIGSKQAVSIPKNAKRTDLNGKFVLPGLINAHSHALLDGSPQAPMSEKKMKRVMKFASTYFGRKIFLKRLKANLENALNAGVTTVRSMGIEPYGTFLEAEVRDNINAGEIKGPRLLTAGNGVIPSGQFSGAWPTSDTPWAARAAVRINIRGGADFIKTFNTGAINFSRKIGDAGRPAMTFEELKACVDESHRSGLPVAVHSQCQASVKEALRSGVDTIEHGAEFDEEMLELAKNNPNSLYGETALVPTFSAYRAIIEHAGEKDVPYTYIQSENAKIILERVTNGFEKCLKSGVMIGSGNDAGVPYVTQYNIWKELRYFIEYGGVSPLEAIHMGTLGTAKVLNIEKETGSLEKGKAVDFIVVEKNPLEDITTLAQPIKVIKNGVLIDNPCIKLVPKDSLV